MSSGSRRPDVPRVIALAFLTSVAGSIGLAVTYLRGGQTQLEGLFLGAAFGGLAYGLVAWSKYLMPNGPFVEERDPFSSEREERKKVASDFAGGGAAIGRRKFLGWSLAAAMGAMGIALVFPVRSLGGRPERQLFQTAWSAGTRLVTEDGEPLLADAIVVGTMITVFPEGHTRNADSQAALIRVEPGRLRLAPEREDWAVDGLVAFSKICTHAGCLVGLYDARSRNLLCPCHQGVFSVPEGARPIAGPVPRPLPQLPLGVDGSGYLHALGDFPEPVGVGFWNRGRA